MAYPSDLKDTQWASSSRILTQRNYGKSRKHSQRGCVNAVFYSNSSLDWLRILLLKKLFNTPSKSPSHGFHVCPLLLNEVHILKIRRQVEERVSRRLQGFFHVFSFMKRPITHKSPHFFSRSFVRRSWITQAPKTAVFTVVPNKLTLKRTLPKRAPITLIRPYAPQSWLPK